MDHPPAIGPQLTRARESLTLSIEDVSHVTRIPARVIQALEADDYGTFPSAAYARGFLTQYSDYLGVDATRALDVIQDDPKVPPAPDILDLSAAAAKSRSGGDTKSSHHWQSLVVILVTSALLYGAVILYRKLDDRLNEARHDAERPLQTSAAPSSQSQQPASAQSPSPTATQTKPTLPEPAPPPRAIIVQEMPADPLRPLIRH